jgi:hypothetical protein
MAATRSGELSTAPGPRQIGMGHNGGPPLEDNPDPGGGRLLLWRRAKKKAWSVPREIALSRAKRAAEIGMSYHDYTLEILERGKYL